MGGVCSGHARLVHERETGVQFFKLLQLSDGAELLSEELYENFEQNCRCERAARTTSAHGLSTRWRACFAKDAEAMEFSKKLPIMAPKPSRALDPKEAKRREAERVKEEKEREKREEKERKEREKAERKERKEREKAAKKAAKSGRRQADAGREMVPPTPTPPAMIGDPHPSPP